MQKENKLSVGQWCGWWFCSNRGKWNGNTEGGYRNLIYRHIIPALGEIPLNKLTEANLQQFYHQLKHGGR